MMLSLPPELERAIRTVLAAAPAGRWLRAAQALSERYRGERTGDGERLVSGPDAALGYAALLLPATYAQLYGAMAATAARVPGWSPHTLLDLGSGPGTALWAAAAQWPSLAGMQAWEREPAFITLGRQLAGQSSHPAVRGATWRRANLAAPGADLERPADLVVLGHVLNELAPAEAVALVAWAWRQTAGVLLLVEPGTSAAFPALRAARDQLLELGAFTLAPCPHDLPCPLLNDWCHFPRRLARPDFQRRARGAPSPWEDAKFCYAAMARFTGGAPIQGRVIREPTANKAYAEALICTVEGVAPHRALKRNREQYRKVRDLVWGEPVPNGTGIEKSCS